MRINFSINIFLLKALGYQRTQGERMCKVRSVYKKESVEIIHNPSENEYRIRVTNLSSIGISKVIKYMHEIDQVVIAIHECNKAMPSSLAFNNARAIREELGPEGKAKDLYDKFMKPLKEIYEPTPKDAIIPALSCVNEILDILQVFRAYGEIEYWMQVKIFLQKMQAY